ncbi:MAG: transglycosylase domain-containing protein, partial [Clostridia bacterium]|nr:transglycosylase domain-containing protein [Clostridia bacterium]
MMKKRHKIRHAIGRILACFLLIGLFSTLILSSAFILYATKGIDASLDMDMLVANQGRTTKLYYTDADGNAVEMEDQRLIGSENRIWIPLEKIPIEVQNAFIAIEDHRFFEHKGMDMKRTVGAVLGFLSGGGHYGGSTITQQLIKNLTGDNSVTPKRKLTEIMRALKLEKRMSKEAILELYLNTVYLSEGCYGLETAAETYFGKSASELTAAEGASLAAVIQYPTKYDPVKNPENNRNRRDTVLWRMHELGLLKDTVYEESIASPTALHLGQKEERAVRNSWFTEVVIEDVIADLSEKYGLSRAAASSMLYNGGLSVYTTMDKKMQETVEQYYENIENFPKSAEGARADSSAVLIDPKSGRLLAVAGAVGEKKSDRIFNLATQMLRSPGSVIKPITVYAPAIEKNLITWASVYDDVPVTFTKEGSGYALWPKNNPRVYAGLTTVNTALCRSTNTVAVRILKQLGEQTSFGYARALGISHLIERENGENGAVLSDIAPAPLALGAVTRGVSVREMTGAYSALACGGVYHETVSYTAVYDKDGKLLLSNEMQGQPVFGE